MDVLLINAGSSSLKFTLMDQSAAVKAGGMAHWSGSTTRYEFHGLDGETKEKVAWRSPGPAVKRAVQDLVGRMTALDHGPGAPLGR